MRASIPGSLHLPDFSKMQLPAVETEMSRRYLAVITRWIPVALRYYNDWPGRPDCGHFFGGVLWYGQDTCQPIATLALAASSPEFDAQAAGISAQELRQIARKGLRYLCFTHDTGPEDCVRPLESWGRPEPAGTKGGERGQGFFRESQCGNTIAYLALTAALIQDLLGEEERTMLAHIALDYLARFGTMAPRSGVYYDTQTEENGWTALGLVASMALLPGHPQQPDWWEQAKRWMFHTTSRPQDSINHAPFADGKTVRELCGRTYTTLPDGTAENHGFVHPSYMASALNLSGTAMNLLTLTGQPIPPHMYWHRQDTYDLLKRWCDETGAFHCVQGMDWPYFAYQAVCHTHAVANCYLRDPDGAYLERLALATVEKASVAHGGRMVPEETVQYCHGQQDPALMRERMAISLACAYLAHRLTGPDMPPTPRADFERRMAGVAVYPHGGALLHRHPHGRTSLAWRNRTMVLPATQAGLRDIGPTEGSMLATIHVRDRAESTQERVLKIREGADQVAVTLVQDLAQDAVRRFVYFASLPNGKCLTYERLVASQAVTVERVQQGFLSIINDGYFGDHPDRRGRRRVAWAGHQETFVGYPAPHPDDDRWVELGDTGWVNVDDRFGLVFQGSGRPIYHHRHHFPVWHAVKDDLILSLQDRPTDYPAGATIAELVALWCPAQTAAETTAQALERHAVGEDAFAATVDGYLCAANFSDQRLGLSLSFPVGEGELVSPTWSVAGGAREPVPVTPVLGPWEPWIGVLA
ncbi:hypothetical protein RY27_06965 [Litorilinea aerophila]|nr:hypothetical protein RY27_06965 [Litorilinea aerophila]